MGKIIQFPIKTKPVAKITWSTPASAMTAGADVVRYPTRVEIWTSDGRVLYFDNIAQARQWEEQQHQVDRAAG